MEEMRGVGDVHQDCGDDEGGEEEAGDGGAFEAGGEHLGGDERSTGENSIVFEREAQTDRGPLEGHMACRR